MALPPTTGAPLFLYVPAYDYGTNPGDDTYDVPENANATLINSFAQTVVLYNPTGTQTIAQPGSTFLNFNKAIAYDGSLRFGTAASVWDSALSRSGPGVFTLDSNTVGNAAATLKLNVLNAVTGLQIDNAAPLNHIPVGDGSHYIDAAQIPTSAANYQRAEFNAGPLTGRNIFNVLTPLTAVDDSGNASTDIGHRTSPVSPSNYTSANITLDAWGHVIAVANGTVSATPGGNLGPAGANTRTIGGGPYHNNSANPIVVEGYLITTAGGADGNYTIGRGPTSGLGTTPFKQQVTATDAGGNAAFSLLIPAGWWYQLNAVGTANFAMGELYETALS